MTRVDGDPVYYEAGYLERAPEMCRLLGVFVARWSLAEASLLYPLMLVSGADEHILVGILASTNSAEGKIKLVKTAIKAAEMDEETRKKINRSLSALEDLCRKRNGFMHHLWCVDPIGTPFTFDFRQAPARLDTPLSKQRRALQTEGQLVEACNQVLQAAYEICAAAGSDWINTKSLELLTLPMPARDP